MQGEDGTVRGKRQKALIAPKLLLASLCSFYAALAAAPWALADGGRLPLPE